MTVGAQVLVMIAVLAFLVHVGFPESTLISRVARVLMFASFVGFCLAGSGTLGSIGLAMVIGGLALAGGLAYWPELWRGARALPRRPLHLVALAVALWGLVVGLHVLGAPGARLLRIPGATGLAPVSVQDAARRDRWVQWSFADAGSRDEVDQVKRAVAGLLTSESSTGCGPTRIVGWNGVYVAGDRALALSRQADECGRSPWRRELILRRTEGHWVLVAEPSPPYEDD